jgi:PAS domain S-box-containing protein
LRVERDKFKGIISSLSEGLDIIDKNYRICFQNEALINRFGDLTGKLCYKAYMKRKIPCKTCQLKKAFRTGKTQKSELKAPDRKIYEITSTPFKDIDGETKAIEIVRDITEIKKSQEKISVSEKRFRELFDHMSSGVVIYEAVKNGQDFIIKDINKAGEKIENLKRKIVMGRSVLEVFPGIKEFGLLDVFKRVWKTGKPEHHPVKLYKDKRIEGWRENYVYKLPTGEIVTVYDDMTEQKKAAEKLKESEKRFRESIMNAPLPVMIHKENGKVISINKAWTEITGYTLDEIPTIEKWTKKAYDKSRKLVKKTIDKLYKIKGRVEAGEFEIKTKTGAKHTWLFSSAPLGKSPDGLRLIVSMALDITERKEKAKEYKILIDGMNDTAFVINFEGKFAEVNNTAVEVLGYTREELLSMGPADIDTHLSSDDIGNLIEGMKKEDKQIFSTEHKTKDGRIIPVEISSSRIMHNGKSHILSIARDITKRKKAEEALRQSEERLSAVFNNTSDLQILFSVEKNEKFKIVNVNKTAVETAKRMGFDVSKENFLGKTVKEIVENFLKPNQRNSEETRKTFQKAVKTGKTVFYEEDYAFGNKIFSAEVTIVPIMDEKGKCLYVLWVAHNITQRKKALEELKESEERFQTVIENLPLGVCLHDLNGNMTLVNKALCELTGYSEEELLTMNVQEVDHLSASRDDRHNLWLKLNKGGHDYLESTLHRKDGSTFPAVIYLNAINLKDEPMILAITQDVTERRNAIEKLKESEERFQTVIENVPHGVCVHDLDGRIRLVNKATYDLTGYRREEMLNMNISDIEPGVRNRLDMQKLWRKIKKEGYARIEDIHHRKNGSSFPVEIYTSAIRLKGEPMILAIVNNITERKKALEKLKESEERFQTVIENLPLGVSVHGTDGKILLVNKTMCDLTGYTKEELLSLNVGDIDRQSITRNDRENLWKKLKKSDSVRFESAHYRKDGSTYPAEIYLSAITIHGKPMLVGIAQDVTSRKEAIKKIKESEEKYKNLHESMRDAFVHVDMEGKIVEFNKHFLDILGYTEKEIKNLNWEDITPKKWHEMETNIINEQIIKEGYSEVYEKEYIKKDGTIIPVELRTFLLKNSENNPEGMWAIVRDISGRKKAEEELRKIERLESLGVLAGGIAHDFNNLLTGILGNLSLAQMGKGEDSEEILEEAKQASIQAKNLTQQLLTFSKGGEPIKGKVNVGEIIRKSAEFSLHGSNVKCEFRFARDLWETEVDKGQMAQVIDNLVINAKQAMPKGGKIRIKAENFILDENKSLPIPKDKYIKITLQDEGIGVPEEYLPKIFDPYFSTKQEGSGLGLATVYSVIQKHGGHITVESQAGIGTSFCIYLPAIKEKKAKEIKEEKPKKPLSGAGKILIMDDEKIVRKAVGGMLQRLGYTVESAEKGEEAISIYKKAMESGEPFDAVILDLTVPGGMGGKDTIDKLLRVDPEVKAIVSSGYSTDPIMANHEKYGFKAVVAKPFDLKDLNETIKKVLG